MIEIEAVHLCSHGEQQRRRLAEETESWGVGWPGQQKKNTKWEPICQCLLIGFNVWTPGDLKFCAVRGHEQKECFLDNRRVYGYVEHVESNITVIS